MQLCSSFQISTCSLALLPRPLALPAWPLSPPYQQASPDLFYFLPKMLTGMHTGNEAVVLAIPRDAFGNIASLTISPTSKDMEMVVVGPIDGDLAWHRVPITLSNGFVEGKLALTVSGAYRFSVLVHGSQVPDSPMAFTVTPGPLTPASCTAAGTAREFFVCRFDLFSFSCAVVVAVAGETSTFSVRQSDKWGNLVESVATSNLAAVLSDLKNPGVSVGVVSTVGGVGPLGLWMSESHLSEHPLACIL